MRVDKAREIALKCLYKVEKQEAYSNIILDKEIEKNREFLNMKDIGLISELVYGVTTWKLTIDYIIQKYSKIKLKKISDWIINILRIGVYQIIFLDKIPKSAAVNESVILTKKYGIKSVSFVNAILRKIDKDDFEEVKNIKDAKQRISISTSMPLWLVEELSKYHELEKVEEICLASNLKPDITIRVNKLKISKKDFINKLKEMNIDYEECELENFLKLKKLKNISNLELFKKGYFTIQDESAGLPVVVLNPKKKECILDACSAPGGKTTQMAEMMENEGEIIAWDLYKERLSLVKQNAERLGIKIIKTEEKNSSKLDEKYIEKFDKILLDVPCLGIGVIRRKPDIKWKRKKEDINEICKIQLEILHTCSKYLKKGGCLVYSTCSILEEENQKIIEKFIKNGKFKLSNIGEKSCGSITRYPNKNYDGFFVCKLEKL